MLPKSTLALVAYRVMCPTGGVVTHYEGLLQVIVIYGLMERHSRRIPSSQALESGEKDTIIWEGCLRMHWQNECSSVMERPVASFES